jgi:hypothetical protein
MKKIFTVILITSSLLAYSQQYNLTFRVDMKEVPSLSDTVSVTGSFQAAAGYPSDWAPGITLMTDSDNDSIYECTVTLSAGVYEFKYINGTVWGQDEGVPAGCAYNGNRVITVNKDTVLPIVCFTTCFACASRNHQLTFRVDMSQVGVIADTVSIIGDFQLAAGYFSNYTPGITLLTDPDMDSIYELTVSIPDALYKFKYVNGTEWGMDESVPAACINSGNRFIDFTKDTVLNIVCFGSCDPCTSVGIEENDFPFSAYFENTGSDFITIEFNPNYSDAGTLHVIDITGKVLVQQEICGQKDQINVSKLSSGLYFLRLLNHENTYTFRIFKL